MTGRIFPFLALIIAGLIVFFYVEPTYSGSIATSRAAISADKKAISAAKDFKTKEDQLSEDKNAIDPAGLARVEKLLPNSVNNVQLILDLNALAAKTAVTLTDITLKSSDAAKTDINNGEGPVGFVDMSLAVTGTYQAFRTFLSAIEHSARLLDVRSLGVSSSQTGVYSYSLSVRLYWLR